MGTLYLDRKDLSLHLDAGCVVIEESGQSPRRIPLKLLERVVIHGQVVLDSRLEDWRRAMASRARLALIRQLGWEIKQTSSPERLEALLTEFKQRYVSASVCCRRWSRSCWLRPG